MSSVTAGIKLGAPQITRWSLLPITTTECTRPCFAPSSLMLRTPTASRRAPLTICTTKTMAASFNQTGFPSSTTRLLSANQCPQPSNRLKCRGRIPRSSLLCCIGPIYHPRVAAQAIVHTLSMFHRPTLISQKSAGFRASLEWPGRTRTAELLCQFSVVLTKKSCYLSSIKSSESFPSSHSRSLTLLVFKMTSILI